MRLGWKPEKKILTEEEAVSISDYMQSRRYNRKLYGRLLDKLKEIHRAFESKLPGLTMTISMSAKYQTPYVKIGVEGMSADEIEGSREIGAIEQRVEMALDEVGFSQTDTSTTMPITSTFETRIEIMRLGWKVPKKLNEGADSIYVYGRHGGVAVIEKGHSYKAVIHPEHWAGIENVLIGRGNQYSYADEQGMRWKVTKQNNDLVFQGIGSRNENYRLVLTPADIGTLSSIMEKPSKPTEAKKQTQNDAIRQAYYKTSDGILALLDAAEAEKDPKLESLVNKLNDIHNEIFEYLNKNYLWD